MFERYTITAEAEEITGRFNVPVPTSYLPRYNAAPSQSLPIITNEAPEEISFFHWGLNPKWSKGKSLSAKLINTQSEMIPEKVSLQNALKYRRCLVIADGFYLWKRTSKKSKIPYRIRLNNKGLFAFAGLWETFEDEDQNLMRTFSIITTTANSLVSKLQDRMPLILALKSERLWIKPDLSIEEGLDLLKRYDTSPLEYHTVSPMISDPAKDIPQMIIPTPPADQHGNLTLFD